MVALVSTLSSIRTKCCHGRVREESLRRRREPGPGSRKVAVATVAAGGTAPQTPPPSHYSPADSPQQPPPPPPPSPPFFSASGSSPPFPKSAGVFYELLAGRTTSVLKELDLTRNSRRYSAGAGKGWRQSDEYRHELSFASSCPLLIKSLLESSWLQQELWCSLVMTSLFKSR